MQAAIIKTRHIEIGKPSHGSSPGLRLALLLAAGLLLGALSGCAALTFPVSGVPAHRVPAQLLGQPKDVAATIDLSLLGQPPPDVYRLGPGDVLGVWIDGILGERGEVPPIHYSGREDLAPAFGYPVTVRADGAISLPLVPPLRMTGLSLAEAEAAIVQRYTTEARLLQPGHDRIMVTLVRPRTAHVVVIRQDAGEGTAIATGTEEIVRKLKRGTGHHIELAAYRNDVLNALAATGGLPGLEAINAIVVQRARPSGPGTMPRPSTVIPLRIPAHAPLPFGPSDVILNSGDVVFIEARDFDVFYTGGLLPTGEHVLPRDYDLDVLEAIAMVGGTIANGGYQTTSLIANTFTAGGLGSPSPSLAMVLRCSPGGGQVPIRVDLNRAMRDPRERILIQPGDTILLQETPGEAVARYAASVFHVFADWQIWNRGDSSGITSVVLP